MDVLNYYVHYFQRRESLVETSPFAAAPRGRLVRDVHIDVRRTRLVCSGLLYFQESRGGLHNSEEWTVEGLPKALLDLAAETKRVRTWTAIFVPLK